MAHQPPPTVGHWDTISVSVAEDGCVVSSPQDITNDTRRGKKHCSLQQVYLLLVGCCVCWQVHSAGGCNLQDGNMSKNAVLEGEGGDNPTVASLFWSFFVPFVNRDSHGGHSSSDFLSRDFSGQW